jgi:exonuclease SbcC
MLLKSLSLRNIRSYLDCDIEFPQGSVLLAGDIGSGKSTILLAIEFALFGIKSSELPGSALLRHGKREGYVELTMEVDGKDILIKRYLKLGANGITQDAGFIIIDGMKKDATPKELRAIVFELLGYPKDLVSRNKDLVYRYTVYTPQEAMKEIIYAKQEDRLDTLRKVFNVDKYKRIRENTVIVLGAMKEKRKELEGYTQDLPEKQKELEQLDAERRALAAQLSHILPQVEQARKKVAEKSKMVEAIENERRQLIAVQKEMAMLDAKLASSLEQRKRNSTDIEQLEKDIAQLGREIAGKPVEDVEKILSMRKTELQQKELERRTMQQHVQSFHAKMMQSEELKQQVLKLDTCPLCKQNVSHEHKASIESAEEKKQQEWSSLLKIGQEKEARLQESIDTLNAELEELRKRHGESAALKLKHSILQRNESEKARKATEQDTLKKIIGEINMKKLDLNLQMEAMKGVEEKYAEAKKTLDNARVEERQLELQHTSLLTRMQEMERMLRMLEKDLQGKRAAIEKLKRLRQAHHWLAEFFMQLMHTMEKHVMLQINREFNELFKSWFSVLMEDETLSVRLDDEFSPLIEQNGYETQIDNLSGGEKTSVALAYRLALNKVINDVVSDIKTKDILMLDEPTDGFSTEQLDKVREVLDMLKISQVIIVSHEAKIESFVDKVIRVSKHEHISKVVSN